MVVCPSQNPIVKSTGSFYNQKLFEHCGNSVFTGLQSGNYSSLLNNQLPPSAPALSPGGLVSSWYQHVLHVL